jgi:STE24 endopeptidase
MQDQTPPGLPVYRWLPAIATVLCLLSAPAAAPARASVAPGPAFDVEAATDAYLSRFTPEQKARSDAYFEGGYWIRLWRFLYGLGVAWILLAGGLSRRLRDLATRVTRRRALQTWLYAAGYLLLATVLTFPLTLYTGFLREHQYGLATQSLLPWLRDRAVGLMVLVVLVPPAAAALYGVLRRAPRTWWLRGAVVAVGFMAVMSLVAPVYIDPLFNKYEPLAAGPVRDQILSMARASGIDAGDVYQFDASRQSTRISANVSGFLGTLRIRLNDNLLNRCTPAEINAVMGHEIGHYVLNHVYKSILFLGLVIAGGFAFIHRAFDWTHRRWGARWGVTGIADEAGLPLLAALFSVYLFVLAPVFNTYIRVNEAEADIFGLHAAREPDGFAEVSLKLGEYRKLDPSPIEEWIFFDHPSGRSRIRMAMQWKAENVAPAGDR